VKAVRFQISTQKTAPVFELFSHALPVFVSSTLRRCLLVCCSGWHAHYPQIAARNLNAPGRRCNCAENCAGSAFAAARIQPRVRSATKYQAYENYILHHCTGNPRVRVPGRLCIGTHHPHGDNEHDHRGGASGPAPRVFDHDGDFALIRGTPSRTAGFSRVGNAPTSRVGLRTVALSRPHRCALQCDRCAVFTDFSVPPGTKSEEKTSIAAVGEYDRMQGATSVRTSWLAVRLQAAHADLENIRKRNK
jgi:hypothetical protein